MSRLIGQKWGGKFGNYILNSWKKLIFKYRRNQNTDYLSQNSWEPACDYYPISKYLSVFIWMKPNG